MLLVGSLEEKWWNKMWLLAYWWQTLLLVTLYIFIYLLFKEMRTDKFKEPSLILTVEEEPLYGQELSITKEQLLFLYEGLPLEVQGEKLYVENNSLFYKKAGENPIRIEPRKVFDFAGGSLQLVRWNDAR